MMSNYGFPGEVPPGVAVEDNVGRAVAYRSTHTPVETLIWFFEQVRNNKDRHLPLDESMDYKQIDPKYADFGNFNYGVVGRAAGIPSIILEYAAGIAQGRADGLSIENAITRSIRDPLNKGDNPEDQVLIRQGIKAADDAGVGYSWPFGTPFPVNIIFNFFNDGDLGARIDAAVDRLTTQASNWVMPRDPLVLDLDGNGITTRAIDPNAPILFDQDGDGIKTATGWIAAGEAIVVRDLDGNGAIDSGRELFGDSTVLTRGPNAGQEAANGFEALADLDLDANGVSDGKFDANDVAYSSVKLWTDANQDGISQADELFTFEQLGVASINVSGAASNVNLGGGNTQTFAGSFTCTDGTAGDSGTASLAGSLLLANNNFYRQFTDDPALTAEALALPGMQGSGVVRDLRPAMSLGSTPALDLQAKVVQFAAATTRDEQRALLGGIVGQWAATATDFQDSWHTISGSGLAFCLNSHSR